MDPERFARLSDKQRACLRLVNQGKRSKEIAPVVGLKPDVVDTYLKGACAILGVNSRHRAASLLDEFEAAPAPKLELQSGNLAPSTLSSIIGPSNTDKDRPPAHLEQAVREERKPYAIAHPGGPDASPIQQSKGGRNGLAPWQRLLWILGVAIAAPIGFVGVMAMLEVVSKLAGR